jgi:hypothetical protein
MITELETITKCHEMWKWIIAGLQEPSNEYIGDRVNKLKSEWCKARYGNNSPQHNCWLCEHDEQIEPDTDCDNCLIMKYMNKKCHGKPSYSSKPHEFFNETIVPLKQLIEAKQKDTK